MQVVLHQEREEAELQKSKMRCVPAMRIGFRTDQARAAFIRTARAASTCKAHAASAHKGHAASAHKAHAASAHKARAIGSGG